MLKVDYWCEDEEKRELIQIFNRNEYHDQNNLRMQYKPDNLFKNRNMNSFENFQQEQVLIKYKEKILFKS